ncbi:ABC transporter ATP-binding protein [Oricola indica]|uniref:ABC transporter ATP-binding protein n=1 Tax=Oricola indica TaxID=2872591 RepID=UPI001CBA7862|nr:ABC transporter ATP-binding protein [Oricola indica]
MIGRDNASAETTRAGQLLSVSDLTVRLGPRGMALVENVSFDVARGETLAIVGESGSGKSLTSLALMGLLPKALHVSPESRVSIHDGGRQRSLLSLTNREMRRIRGAEIGMIFQEPMTSLNPLFTIGNQIEESLSLHTDLRAAERKEEVIALLERVGIREPEARVHAYPHELSGGMRQRTMIAMALAGRPRLLIADEPTTALDVTIQAQILDLLRDLRNDLGMAMIFVTHDLGVVSEIADRALVMQSGEVVEAGKVHQILTAPKHPYTRALIAAVPSLDRELRKQKRPSPLADPLVSIRDTRKTYTLPEGQIVRALNGVSLQIERGEVLGIVGESGSGKSTVAKILVGLETADSGDIQFEGHPLSYDGNDRLSMRRAIQMIFQDPFAALNPRWRIDRILTEPMIIHGLNGDRSGRRRAAAALLERVGMPPAALDRFPHEFSGGQRQRLSIARSLAVQPRLLIADESVSALDVTVQAQVLALLAQVKADMGMTIVFIAHDLAVVRGICDRVGVMRHGELVELGPVAEIFARPTHDYTRNLIAAVPRMPMLAATAS